MKSGKEVANEIVMVAGALLFVGLIVGWAIDGFLGGMVGVVVAAPAAFVYGITRKRLFLMRLEKQHER